MTNYATHQTISQSMQGKLDFVLGVVSSNITLKYLLVCIVPFLANLIQFLFLYYTFVFFEISSLSLSLSHTCTHPCTHLSSLFLGSFSSCRQNPLSQFLRPLHTNAFLSSTFLLLRTNRFFFLPQSPKKAFVVWQQNASKSFSEISLRRVPFKLDLRRLRRLNAKAVACVIK